MNSSSLANLQKEINNMEFGDPKDKLIAKLKAEVERLKEELCELLAQNKQLSEYLTGLHTILEIHNLAEGIPFSTYNKLKDE